MVICQKDLGVIPEDRPSYHSRPPPRYNVDGEAESRSCLVVPSFGKKKKKGPRSGLLASSSSSTTDQSSTADHIYSQNTAGDDRKGLLESANRLTTNTLDWYTNDVESVGGNSSTPSTMPDRAAGADAGAAAQFVPPSPSDISANSSVRSGSISSRQPRNNNSSSSRDFNTPPSKANQNMSNDSSANSSGLLLSFPTPTDRSHTARRKSERKHAYDGEMEPEGVRGQEAEVIPVVSPEPSIPIRQFSGGRNDRPSPMNLNTSKNGFSSRSGTNNSTKNNNLNDSTTSSQDIRSMLRSEFDDHGMEKETPSPPVHRPTTAEESPSPTFGSPRGRQFLNSSPVMLSETHNAPSQQRQQRDHHHHQQRALNYKNYSMDESDTSETTTGGLSEIVRNNVAEIIQQQEPSPAGRRNLDNDDDADDFEPQLYAIPSALQQQHTTPPRGDPHLRSAKGPRMGRDPSTPRSTQSSPSHGSFCVQTSLDGSQTTDDTPMTFRGQSAPVNVDDTSFEAPEENVTGIHAMAMEHVMKGEYDMALQAFSQVLKVYLDVHGRAHPLTASAYHNLGTVHSKRAGLLLDHTMHQRHCREQALLCFQAAARSARDSPQLGPSHPNVAVSLVRIGFLLLQSRQYQNAVITFHEALRIRVEHYGETHGLVANLYNNLGVCHMHLQDFQVGRKYLQHALDIQKQLLNEDEFSTTALLELADTLCNIGGLCLEWIRQQGPDARHALDAESAFLEAMEVRTKVLGENHALTNQVRSLHDMVRSIPLPKLSPRSKSSLHSCSGSSVASSTASPARRARISSVSSASMSPSMSAEQQRSTGRPYATAASPPRPTEQQQSRAVTAGSDPPGITPNHNRSQEPQHDDLQMPSLNARSIERSINKPPAQQRIQHPPPLIPNGSQRSAPSEANRSEPGSVYSGFTNKSMQTLLTNRTVQSELGSSVFESSEDMECYDASEESCLLAMHEDQASTVVSYSQTTSKRLEANSKTPDDRLECLEQAKAVLNAHQQYMDSPRTSTLLQEAERSHPHHDVANEDGLAPLGGTWPSPATNERITQDILQDPVQHLHTIQNCASNNMKRGRYGEALHLLKLVLECQRDRNGMLHEDVGSALHNVGIAHLRMEDYYEALQSFEEAVRVRQGALGRDHPQVAVSLVKVGISLMLLKRLEDSLWIFREALTVRKHGLGALHPSTARIYNNIGCVHVEFQELKEARRAFEAALDIQRNALVNDPDNGPIIFGAATTLQNLAILYQKRGLQEKAVVVLDEARLLQENVLGESHPTVLETLDRLAEASADANLGSAAMKHNSELLERLYGEANFDKVQEATILYRMSKIHKQHQDVESQIGKLHLANKVLITAIKTKRSEALSNDIQHDLHMARQLIEKQQLDWV